jgi:putative transposase
MPHSLSAVYLHIIFSTKDRRPFLTDLALRGSLHAYLGAIGKELDCLPISIGGVADHVHLLMSLSRTKSQAELVKELKRNSTTWIKQQNFGLADFQWQNGYAIFSVSQSNLPEVREYIEKQEEHHRTRTFQEELVAFLKRHQQVYDEKYLWD